MKKLILLVLLAIMAITSQAQPFGNKNTNVNVLGGMVIDSLLLPPLYSDTPTSARIKINGSMIRVVKGGDTGIYVYVAPQWRKLSQNSGGAITPTLAQVTNAGNSTADTIKGIDFTGNGNLFSFMQYASNMVALRPNVKMYTCILRPSTDSLNNITWRFLGWSDDHDTLHAKSITVNGTYIQVNIDTCTRVLACLAVPDDDFAGTGVMVGAKGNLSNIQIYGSAPRGEWSGYFTWTGGTFTPEYVISDMVFDTSVSPTYSFKITNPTPMNPNYGNGLTYTSNYSGQNYARWSVQYMGNHGYAVSRYNDHYNPIFTVLDAAGNKVPNTAMTSTDLFMIKTSMDRRFPMSWNFNVNNFITSNSNVWVFALMEK